MPLNAPWSASRDAPEPIGIWGMQIRPPNDGSYEMEARLVFFE